MPSDENKRTPFIPVLICAIALPLSLFLWVGNVALSAITKKVVDSYAEETIPPTRWFAAIAITIAFIAYGLKRNSLDKSGAALGTLFGVLIITANYSFFACLATFYLAGSKATRFRSEKKSKFEEDFKPGGQRNWIQVLCNGGMAAYLSLLYLVDVGCGERPIDFIKNYRSSWLSLGVLGTLACCAGDTFASELATVIGSEQPFLITNRKKVPKGTNGGITFLGLLVSFLGGALVGTAHYVSLLYCIDRNIMLTSPSQLPLILVGGFAGLAGSLFDSYLGAVLQFSGKDKKTGLIVSHPGKGIEHICGLNILDNDSVNFISSIVMGLIIPPAANIFFR